MEAIYNKDPEMMEVIEQLLCYLESTYSDKYTAKTAIDTTFYLQFKTYNCGQMAKYLHRYSTEGYEKSGNIKDLYKLIHYALFELKRLELEATKENESTNPSN